MAETQTNTHDEGDGGTEHEEHKHVGFWGLVLTWVALFILTLLSFSTTYVHWGTWNIVIALGIAVTKALLVLLIFMHLIEQRFATRLAMGFAALLLTLLVSGMAADVASRHTFPMNGENLPPPISQTTTVAK